MPRISELQPGDLISDIDDDDHFMIWVGGDLPLVENVDTDDYSGIFQHSDSKLRERLKASTNSNKDEENDKQDVIRGFDVFRCKNAAIAKQAAKFAIEWATSKNDALFIEGKKTDEKFNLKVPFNQDRLIHKREQKYDEWDARSLFRALRVLARHESGLSVSIKGWTCSSFVTYCFQAAALKVLFQDGPIRPVVLDTIRRGGSKDFLSIKNDLNLIQLILSDLAEIVRQLVPKGILVDGKAISAGDLRKFLKKSNNNFQQLGNITA